MKIVKNTKVARLLARFDNELKNLLTNDLKAFGTKNTFLISKTQAMTATTLSVA
jgi:hypothetical protein